MNTNLIRKLSFVSVVLLILLFACFSCADDDDLKLPNGYKPEILIGKWQSKKSYIGWSASYYYYTYELSEGGYIIRDSYANNENYELEHKRDTVRKIIDWVYDGDKTLWFIGQNGNYTSRSTRNLSNITQDSIIMAGTKYYRIED